MTRPVRGVLVQEGTQTGDGRLIVEGAITWAPLPLPIGWLVEEQHADMVSGAEQVGIITGIERQGNDVTFIGEIDDDQEAGAELVRRLEAGTAASGNRIGVSIDPDDWEVQIISTQPDEEGSVVIVASGSGSLITAAAGDPDPGDGSEAGSDAQILFQDAAEAIVERYTRLRIRGATCVAIPAFDGAYMELDDSAAAPAEPAPVAASAASNVVQLASPPAAFFAEPEPVMGDERLVEQPGGSFAVPLTITDEGHVYGHLAPWGACFAGETEFITRDGVKTLKECVDTVQRVLVSKATGPTGAVRAMEYGGRWVDADIRSFGVQPLMKVTLGRFGQTKEVYATAEHRWVVTPLARTKDGSRGYRSGRRQIVTTKNLTPDTRLGPLFPSKLSSQSRPTLPSPFGVAQGFVFGDGTRSDNGGTMAYFFGKKDEALLPYFSMCPSFNKQRCRAIDNLPAHWKDLPSRHETTQHLYGWLAGYFAADGTVNAAGLPMLFSAERANLEFVRDICLRLGIATTGVRTFLRKGINDVVRPLHRITMLPGTLTKEFFIGVQHRERFLARPSETQEYTAWRVIAVEETERVEEVYCAVVPTYENFTLADNINVMNCHTGYPGACITPPDSMAAYAHFHVGEVRCDDSSRVATGTLTVGCDHAAARAMAAEARDHYAHSGLAWADVRCSTGEWGPWVSGALRPGINADTVRVLRASALSGDWRRIGGHLELIAALSVNSPGFPIAREALAASGLQALPTVTAAAFTVDGVQQSLVASQLVVRCPECAQRARMEGDQTDLRAAMAGVTETLARIERRTRHLVPQSADAMLASIRAV